MFRKIFTLAMLFVFAIAGASFAGVKALPDQALDDVSAGDWVVLNPGSGNESVVDVYNNNNTLDLLQESQKDIQAVSNANSVDSATVVQTNVARVSSDQDPTQNVAINGTNAAEINNYRPVNSTSSTDKTTKANSSDTSSSTTTTTSDKTGTSSSSKAGETTSATSLESKTFNLLDTENTDIAIANSSIGVGKEISVTSDSNATTIDNDLTITAVCTKSSGSSSSKNSEEESESTTEKTSSATTANTNIVTSSETSESSSSTHDAEDANNHINLLGNAQQNIKAVSNLNAVASGVAVQTNIASNVGVGGSITHVNSATVSSGGF